MFCSRDRERARVSVFVSKDFFWFFEDTRCDEELLRLAKLSSSFYVSVETKKRFLVNGYKPEPRLPKLTTRVFVKKSWFNLGRDENYHDGGSETLCQSDLTKVTPN